MVKHIKTIKHIKTMIFYIYKLDDKFIKITKNLRLKLVPKIESYWVSKKSAETWKAMILYKYPNAELCEAELILKRK